MAERAFVEKLHKVGFGDVEVADRRAWGIDDCSRYPLFGADLIALMRELLPPERHDSVANVVMVQASKPGTPARGRTTVPEARRYDAGDLGCGDGLARVFRSELNLTPVGGVLEVVVSDPAAKADLPPLARLMGHEVLSEDPLDGGRALIAVKRSR